ncbi:ATP-binding protein [Bacillus haynesii]|uniref:ATP-binding protein n=1 Tax=Bacillus haynesii TaxID=1925021 RepID=UPI00228062CA|nr:ATP-binding protein [Bacillus haynesii]MCY8574328.1 ATP-binding protein [Bacillus haynesii]MCY9434267.1 ATP-binding protein [Bacillus haynesii]
MPKRTIEEVMDELRNRSRLSQGDKPEESDAKRYDCPKCKDELGFIERRGTMEVWVSCTCREWRKAQKLLKSSEITEQFKNLNFAQFKTEGKHQSVKEAYECAVEYVQAYRDIQESRRNSIALLGQPGSGKTHLLTAAANELMRKLFVPVLYFPFVEGFNDLKQDFSLLEDKLNRMKQVDVLFLDDMFKPVGGRPRATEWQIEQTYAVVNYRYLNHKPFMLSSELSVEEIVSIDEALGTRLVEMCQDFLVVLNGSSFGINHRLEGMV